MQTHELINGQWQYTLAYRIAYFVKYYRNMGWKIYPQDILEMCADECEEWNSFGWNTLMSARNYLRRQDRTI